MDEKFMFEAIKLAEEDASNNFKHGGPFGAVIVDKDGNIIGKGKNSVIKNHDATAHAEIMAIRDAGQNMKTFNLESMAIYTSCYPCPMCLAAILWAGIDKIYYANTKDDAANIGFRDSAFYDMIKQNDFESVVIKQMSRDEALKTFEEYQNNTERIEY